MNQLFDRSLDILDLEVSTLLNNLEAKNLNSVSDLLVAWANISIRESDGSTLSRVLRLLMEHAVYGGVDLWCLAQIFRAIIKQINPNLKVSTLQIGEGKTLLGASVVKKGILSLCGEYLQTILGFGGTVCKVRDCDLVFGRLLT